MKNFGYAMALACLTLAGAGCQSVSSMSDLQVVDNDGDGVKDEVDTCPDTQPYLVVDEQGCHIKTEILPLLQLSMVLPFTDDSTVIDSKFFPEFRVIAEQLTEFPDAQFIIDGYRKPDENEKLGSRRASAFANDLIDDFGIPSSSIQKYDCGYQSPNDVDIESDTLDLNQPQSVAILRGFQLNSINKTFAQPRSNCVLIKDADVDGIPDLKDKCSNTKPHYVVDDKGCPITDDKKRELTAEIKVFFDQNSTIVDDKYRDYNESRITIDEMANLMKRHPNSLLKIEGNMSVVEALDKPNLSRKRATSVVTLLASTHQINPNRIIMVDCKANQPIALNSLEGIKFNQRVYGQLQKQNESWNRQRIIDAVNTNQRCELIFDKDGDGVTDDLDQCPNTPAMMIIDDRGCPKKAIPENDEIIMDYQAYFKVNTGDLEKPYQKELDVLARKLAEYQDVSMKIYGAVSSDEWELERKAMQTHAQETFPIPLMSQLARARANSIKQYLNTQHNIETERMTTFDCGNRMPITKDTRAEQAYNRRVYVRMTNIQVGDDDTENNKADDCMEF